MSRRDEEREASYLAAVAALREATASMGDAPPCFAEIATAVQDRLARPARGDVWPRAWRLGLAGGVALAAAASVLLALLLPGAVTLDPEPADGLRATEVQGPVSVSMRTGQRPLWQADTLEAGVRLETDVAASTTLVDPQIAEVAVAEQTVVHIARWSQKESVLALDHGRIDAHVVPRRSGETFRVTTPCGHVEVVGTVFVVRHQPGEGTRVTTVEGVVEVHDSSGAGIARLTAGGAVTLGPLGCTDVPPDVGVSGDDATPLAAVRSDVGEALPSPPEATVATDGSPETLPALGEIAVEVASDEVTPDEVAVEVASDEVTPDEVAVEVASDEVTPDEVAVEVAVDEVAVEVAPDEVAEGVDAAPVPARRTRRGSRHVRSPAADGAESTAVAAISEPVVATPSEHAMAVYADARTLLVAGDDARAIALLDEASSAPSPHRARLLALLGDARRVAGRHQAARGAYEAAIEDGGDGAEGAAIDLATLCETHLNDAACARDAWTTYLARSPNGRHAPRALLARARLLVAAGNVADARADWRRLLADHAGAVEATHALVLLGRSLLADDDWAAAEALFGAWIDTPGKRGEEALVGLLRVRLAQGRPDAARALALRHRDRFPDGARRGDVDALLERLGGEGGP